MLRLRSLANHTCSDRRLSSWVSAPALVLLLLTLVIAACGDGVGSESSSPSAPAETTVESSDYDPATARALAIQSRQMDDPVESGDALRDVTRLAPSLVDGWLLLAAHQVEQGDVDGAFASLGRVDELGIRAPIDGFPPLEPLHDDPRWTDLLAKLDRHLKPAGSSDVLFTLEENDLLTEGVAYDAGSDSWFVSAVHGRKIVRLGPDGSVGDWVADMDDVWGVFGLAVDVERRKLWAATAMMPQVRGFDPEEGFKTALLEMDIETAAILGRFELPEPTRTESDSASEEPTPGQLNDLVVAGDGTVYATDLRPPGGVYRLSPESNELERIGEAMLTNSPQGIVLVADDSLLLVADYSLGLVALDLESGDSWFVEPPDDLWLQALDGLSSAGDRELVAIQNGGYPPHRILRLKLGPDAREIVGWTVAAQALPQWREPTLGLVVRDGSAKKFVYVAASQWPLFPEGGEPDAELLRPPVVMSLDLIPHPALDSSFGELQ